MSSPPTFFTHRSPQPRGGPGWLAGTFGLIGGPAAWYLQLCAGYALASGPCFPHDQRRVAPLEGFGWTWPALVAVLVAGVLIALAACRVSWGVLRRTQREVAGHHPVEVDAGRTCFLALWGMVFGAGFAVATLVTAVAYIVLPRCAG